MKILVQCALFFLIIVSVPSPGRPWNKQPQQIPGLLQCEWYDLGGEGIAYHDTDSVNNGSGKLNPANGNLLNEFRKHEAPDISYTKPGGIDDNPWNVTSQQMHQLYLGWTQPGEWTNYTVAVKESGAYQLGLMFTSNAGGVIRLDLDHHDWSGALAIPPTADARDTVAWRQWHHWRKIDSITTLHIKKGAHLITLQIVEKGNMNFDYLQFTKK